MSKLINITFVILAYYMCLLSTWLVRTCDSLCVCWQDEWVIINFCNIKLQFHFSKFNFYLRLSYILFPIVYVPCITFEQKFA